MFITKDLNILFYYCVLINIQVSCLTTIYESFCFDIILVSKESIFILNKDHNACIMSSNIHIYISRRRIFNFVCFKNNVKYLILLRF